MLYPEALTPFPMQVLADKDRSKGREPYQGMLASISQSALCMHVSARMQSSLAAANLFYEGSLAHSMPRCDHHVPCIGQDPLAIIGLVSILLPFIILGIAIATGVIDTSAGSSYATGK